MSYSSVLEKYDLTDVEQRKPTSYAQVLRKYDMFPQAEQSPDRPTQTDAEQRQQIIEASGGTPWYAYPGTFGRSVGRGAVRATGMGMSGLSRILTDVVGLDPDVITGTLLESGNAVQGAADQIGLYPGSEGGLTQTIGEAGGTAVPAMVAAATAGPAGLALFGASTGYESTYQNVLELGGTKEQAQSYAKVSALVTGVTEPFLGVAKSFPLFRRADDALSGWLTKRLGKEGVAKAVAKTGVVAGEEAIEEVIQEIPDEVARHAYKEDRNLWDTVKTLAETGAIGGTVGLLLGGIVNAPAFVKAMKGSKSLEAIQEKTGELELTEGLPLKQAEAEALAKQLGGVLSEGQLKLIEDYDSRKASGQKDPVPTKQAFTEAGYEDGGGTRKERAAITQKLVEVRDAQTVRGDQGQVQEAGILGQSGEAQGGANLRGNIEEPVGGGQAAAQGVTPRDIAKRHLESVWGNKRPPESKILQREAYDADVAVSQSKPLDTPLGREFNVHIIPKPRSGPPSWAETEGNNEPIKAIYISDQQHLIHEIAHALDQAKVFDSLKETMMSERAKVKVGGKNPSGMQVEEILANVFDKVSKGKIAANFPETSAKMREIFEARIRPNLLYGVPNEAQAETQAQAAPEAVLGPEEVDLELGSPAELEGVREVDPTALRSDPVLAAPMHPRDRMPMRLAPPPTGTVSTDAPEIIKSLESVVDAFGGTSPIRVGRIAQRKALGIFKVRPEVVRLRVANDIDTASHEVGHAIDKAITARRAAPANVRKELIDLGRRLYGTRKPKGGYESEGFAEITYYWLADRATGSQLAPNAMKWYEALLAKNPEGFAAMQQSAQLFQAWQQQGSVLRAQASVVDTGTIGQRAKRAAQGAKRAFSFASQIDALQPLRILGDEAEAKLGHKLPIKDDPFYLATSLRLTHDARVAYMVNHGMIDPAGNIVGKSLNDALAPIKGKAKQFFTYLYAKRAVALWTDPKRKGGRNPGISLKDAQQVISELESHEFKVAAQSYYDWNDGILNYAASLSPVFSETVKRIRASDPGFYVPLSREFDEMDKRAARLSGGQSAERGEISRRLYGSGRRIKDIGTQTILNARSIVLAAHRRAVLDAMVRLSKIEGMGWIVEEVPKANVPVTSRTIQQLLEEIVRRTAPGQKPPDMGSLAGEVVTFFAPETRPKNGEPIIPIVDQNGKLRFYQLDRELFDALNGMEQFRMGAVSNILEWVAAKPARLFRAGTTGLRASFGLVTNPLRDVQTMYINSRANANGLQMLYSWAKSVGDTLVDAATLGRKRNPYLDAFMRLGGEMSQPLGMDVQPSRRAARNIVRGWKVKTVDPRNWFDLYRDVVQLPESAGRVAELREVAKDVGWTPGTPMTLEQSMQMLRAAKEVTVDFAAAGETARVLNQIIPFYNAAIQGPRASIRSAMADPKKFAIRGLIGLTLPTLALWWKYRDEEWYKEMRAKEKFLFWHIPVSLFREKTLLRIPRAFDLGQMFASLPEMFLDAWYRESPEPATEWAETVLETLAPDIRPVLVREGWQQAANWDDFWDRPIVPQSMERRPREEQFDEYTSKLSITLGDIFNVSPKRIDHAIRGIGGQASGDVVDVLGLGPKGVERESELADTLILGRLFQRGGELGTRPKSIQTMYEMLDSAYSNQASVQDEETKDERRARLMLEDASRAVSNLLYVRSQTSSVSGREALTREALSIAKDAVNRIKTNNVKTHEFESERKETERRRKAAKPAA